MLKSACFLREFVRVLDLRPGSGSRLLDLRARPAHYKIGLLGPGFQGLDLRFQGLDLRAHKKFLRSDCSGQGFRVLILGRDRKCALFVKIGLPRPGFQGLDLMFRVLILAFE